MKYWRGYLVAAIFAACTWAFQELASTHTKLVDMIYPYVTRMVQNYLAGWSGAVDFCVWQAVVLALATAAFASVVLMIFFRWNPIQWFGWILSVVSLIVLLNTGVFGLNVYSGPISEDMRLPETEFNQTQIKDAAIYYRDKANDLAETVARNSDGTVKLPGLDQLNAQAENGFKHLVYDEYYSVFAGSTAPVKALGLTEQFSKRGIMGLTVSVTGESAVNMDAPSVMIPYAICREMCYRMSIASEADNTFAAFMVCQANEDPLFQYAGYIVAYQHCLDALPGEAAKIIAAHANSQLREDLQIWNEFISRGITEENAQEKELVAEDVAKLMVSWNYLDVTLPAMTEPEVDFDPMDEYQVDLSTTVNLITPEVEEEEPGETTEEGESPEETEEAA